MAEYIVSLSSPLLSPGLSPISQMRESRMCHPHSMMHIAIIQAGMHRFLYRLLLSPGLSPISQM